MPFRRSLQAPTRVIPAMLYLWLLGCLLATAAASQSAPGSRLPGGSISGMVVDGETGLPLPGAVLILQPESGGAFPSPSGRPSAFLEASRSTLSDSLGRYLFRDLPPGRYRLRIELTGYGSATAAVELRGAADSRVAIGLSVAPITLQPVAVTVEAAAPYGRGVTLEDEVMRRLVAERLRQRRYLAGDVQTLTHADVIEAVTLAETDLFRALQRLPGVSTRDDYTAELWTRGARWDQTRAYLDGMPLFNPLHAWGGLSGVNTDALGAAVLHPGVQPAGLSDGAAGLVDLRTRRGEGEGRLRGLGELSLISGRLALDQQLAGGRAAWMLAARRSYLDWLFADDEEDGPLPFYFADVTGRFDLRIDPLRTLEVSGLVGENRIEGDVLDLLQDVSRRWGNRAGRVTLETPLRGGRVRHTLGASRSAYRAADQLVHAAVGASPGEGEAALASGAIAHYSIGGEWTPAQPGRVAAGAAGYEVIARTTRFRGPSGQSAPLPGDRDDLSLEASSLHGALWGEQRWQLRERLALQIGLRLELGEAVAEAGRVRSAPRISSRYEVSPNLSLSAGLGRSFQYAQAVAAAAGESRLFAAHHRWLLAGDSVPPVRSDIGTLGAEYWAGNGWLLAVNGFLRRSTGIAFDDPAPGSLEERVPFVTGETLAHGAEASLRRLAGRWTVQTAYSYGVASARAGGMSFPAAEDRRHSLDATAMLRVGQSLRLGSAFSARSGPPFTRYFRGTAACDAAGVCGWAEPPRVEAPGAQRAPPYASLDLLLDWTRSFRSWRLGAYLQLHNALGRRNASTYVRSCLACEPGGGVVYDPEHGDIFLRDVPRAPLFGLRVAF